MTLRAVAHPTITFSQRAYKMRCFLLSVFLLCMPCLSMSSTAVAKEKIAPPNIVFILVDDMGWKDAGCLGSHYYRTPNIDGLADKGMIFNRAYSAGPVCSPSRASIYTGKYAARHKLSNVFSANLSPDDRLWEVSKPERGNIQNLEALNRHCISPKDPTIAETVASSPYRTGFVGKWHCGWAAHQMPDARGFDYAVGFRTTASYTSGHWGKTYNKGNAKNMEDIADDVYMTDALAQKAVDFIRKNKENPFLLVVSHYAVHGPLQAPAPLVKKYKELPTADHKNPVFAGMITKVDESVGAITAELERHGLTDNTIVIFTSDNGGASPRSTSNYPLMGAKSFCYEAGMRVPLIVRWPGHVAAKSTCDTPTVGIDFFPTWLDLMGIKKPEGLVLDGVSIRPLIEGKKTADRPIYFHFPHYTHATGPFSSVIADDWKLIRFYNDTSGKYQLFNLDNDPHEQKDLSVTMPEKVKELDALIDSHIKRTDGLLPRPNPDYDPSAKPKKDKDHGWNMALGERELHGTNLKAYLDQKKE